MITTNCNLRTDQITYAVLSLLVFAQLAFFLTSSDKLDAQFWWVLAISMMLIFGYLLIKQSTLKGPVFYFLSSWGAGGLGMLIGHAINSIAQTNHHQHHHNSNYFDLLLSLGWSLPIMLIMCIPTCMFLCKKDLQLLRSWQAFSFHILTTITMVAGMLLAMEVSQYWKQDIIPFEHHHLMVIGMAVTGTTTYIVILRYSTKLKSVYLNQVHQKN